ncbi:hypothetical protein RYE50_17670 [Clostridioides difficile]|uniref:Uncharacterized protein n=2 Tax=root TaxID=1 RepID=J9QE38_9CAUD|nr:hypothetical protein [Clostridioides difficile]YP_006990593.1 hypothetical protein D864_gp39 [Clostridium phage phiMMP04]AFO72175.1 hypothetical protein phiMMP04_gp38 [Clostridium phage phiMMP04]EGT3729275.1 hypothetical protein [Clostridioides difficile]EGT3734806.1 hypothetical protein [Clostridioides difficile]EGT3772869.1 hypothetical protein [Clostridioides difficile]EGT3885211.1 hypothetical protein [Clostridioides difficile]
MYIENIEELKELIELFGVVEAKSESVVSFGEVESLDSCTEENAEKALDILSKHKREAKNEEENEFVEFKLWTNKVEEREEIFADIACCEKCGRIFADSEELTSFPVLTSYDRKRSVFEQLETVAICPNCLMNMTRIYESPF